MARTEGAVGYDSRQDDDRGVADASWRWLAIVETEPPVKRVGESTHAARLLPTHLSQVVLSDGDTEHRVDARA